MDEELTINDYPNLRNALFSHKAFAFKAGPNTFAFYQVDENTLLCVGLGVQSDEQSTVWRLECEDEYTFKFIEQQLTKGTWVICEWPKYADA